MLLGFIILIVIAIIVYFHYLQGLFSAAISAVLAMTCAVAALAWYEPVVALLPRSQFSDQTGSVVLVGLFAVPYILLRTIFDKLIPGNVSFPTLVGQIGSAAMGLIAALFATGVLLIAVKMMPIGPRILFYEEYPISQRMQMPIRPPGSRGQIDAWFEELDPVAFHSGNSNGLLIPADKLLTALVAHVSEEYGSLSNGRPFAAVHPDLSRALYGQRTGIQPGSLHTATPGPVDVLGVYSATTLPLRDQEAEEFAGSPIGHRGRNSPSTVARPPNPMRPDPGHLFLIVRVRFNPNDVDPGKNTFSFSTGAVHLVASRKLYFPIGTLEGGTTLWWNTPDDYLFAQSGKGADLVFHVDEADVLASADPADRRVARGTLISVKRYARTDIGGRSIADLSTAPRSAEIQVLRKGVTAPAAPPPPSVGPGPSPTDQRMAQDVPLAMAGAPVISSQLFASVGVGAASPDERSGLAAWGTFALSDNTFTRLELDPIEPIARMERSPNPIRGFDVPGGQRMVQVAMRPVGDPWAWAEVVGDFALVSDGMRFTPHGFMARVQHEGQQMMAAYYDSGRPLTRYAVKSEAARMQPQEVILLFVVRPGISLNAMNFRQGVVQNFQPPVPVP